MKHQEFCKTLKEYIELYEHSNKKRQIEEYVNYWNFSYKYDVILIKTGYKFSTFDEFIKLCNSDVIWPQELLLKENPEIRVNVFRWTIENGNTHRITIWNDISSQGIFYKDIIPGKPTLTKEYLTSIEEIKKCIFAGTESRYYVPIELSNITSDKDDIEDVPDVTEDIADILSEDMTNENIDSYTDELIEESQTDEEILS